MGIEGADARPPTAKGVESSGARPLTVVGVEGIDARVPATAGAMLAAAREAAGLSVDAVAQQLKLAPRQVKAIEESDYGRLPGRTFVRGFVKSYARLVHLDPDRVLSALPAGAASSLEAPRLHPTAPTMGELPTNDHAKPSWTRWAIPITLAAIVLAAGMYEWLRPSDVRGDKAVVIRTERPQAAVAPPPASTPLPNPLSAGAPAPVASAIEPATSTPTPAPAPEPNPPASLSAVDQALTLAFRDTSWTEVRDRDGRVLLSGMNPAGTERALSGNPPLELVIGNAADVSLTYRGHLVDLAPYTRQNVARLSLP